MIMEEQKKPFLINEYTPKALDTSLKTGFKTLMSNIGTVIAVMCVMLLVAVFWFDISLEDVVVVTKDQAQNFILDTIITVILYVIMQNSMILNGEKNGQIDKDYLAARERTVALRERAKMSGCKHMGVFCDRYAAAELRDTRTRRLSKIPMKYSEWHRVFGDMTGKDIKKLPKEIEFETEDGRMRTLVIDRRVKLILLSVATLEEQRFTPEMLMYDDTNHSWRRTPLLPSPSELIRSKRRSNYIPIIVFSTMTAMLVFKFVASPTWATTIYCFFKLFGLIWRGASGYSIGFLAYSVNGVQYYQSQELRFNEYERWLSLEDGENDDCVFDF
jgi:hypothetical protein